VSRAAVAFAAAAGAFAVFFCHSERGQQSLQLSQ
jgi:hypothetical protein